MTRASKKRIAARRHPQQAPPPGPPPMPDEWQMTASERQAFEVTTLKIMVVERDYAAARSLFEQRINELARERAVWAEAVGKRINLPPEFVLSSYLMDPETGHATIRPQQPQVSAA